MPDHTHFDTLIVGGGLAGLVAATQLAREGQKVRLLERSTALGGRARTTYAAGHALNLGPHALYRAGALAEALKELDVAIDAHRVAPTGFFLDGDARHTAVTGFASLLTTGALTLAGKVELARFMARMKSFDADALARTTVQRFFDDTFADDSARRVALALARLTTYADDPAHLSAGALLGQLVSGTYAGVDYVDGGWTAIVDGLAEAAREAGAELVTGARVERVERTDDGFVVGVRSPSRAEPERGADHTEHIAGIAERSAHHVERSADIDERSADIADHAASVAERRADIDERGAHHAERGAHHAERSIDHGAEPTALVHADRVILALDPTTCARLFPCPALDKIAARARPVRAASLDVALSRLPDPRAIFALGLDEPTYFSVHSVWADVAPRGAATIHAAAYLGPDDAHTPEGTRAMLERTLDRMQPGWREVVVHERFLPNLVVTPDAPDADRGGLAGRPDVDAAGVEGLLIAGDWVGPTGMLADAAAASGRAAAAHAVTRRTRAVA
ncbi:MAG: FAD-dependent oxidoreductase [Deltaproteobacteria bacterium]